MNEIKVTKSVAETWTVKKVNEEYVDHIEQELSNAKDTIFTLRTRLRSAERLIGLCMNEVLPAHLNSEMASFMVGDSCTTRQMSM